MSISKTLYEQNVRVRVCGLLRKNNSILLLKHQNIGKDKFLWSPPGGGVDFGESIMDTLVREFFEETHLMIDPQEYLFVNEYIDHRFHAIEIFFSVKYISGKLQLGGDPEVPANEQILTEACFLDFEKIKNLPKTQIHNIFQFCDHPKEVFDLRGFFNFRNI